ncbi:MAG: hypothetical protein ABFC57_10185 [Veillonellales bacterium]
MELLIVVVLLAILYLVPELLRRRKSPAEYKYPDIPAKTPPTKKDHRQQPAQRVPALQDTYQQTVMPAAEQASQINQAAVMPLEVSKPFFLPGSSAWQGKLDRNAVINGVIFSEILQPPRAYRPVVLARTSLYRNREK